MQSQLTFPNRRLSGFTIVKRQIAEFSQKYENAKFQVLLTITSSLKTC